MDKHIAPDQQFSIFITLPLPSHSSTTPFAVIADIDQSDRAFSKKASHFCHETDAPDQI